MKKFILTLAICLMSFFSVNAQIATENQKLFDNVYVGVNGGVTTPLNFKSVFPVNPTGTIVIGKQFSPVWGGEIEGTAWFGSHAAYSPTLRLNSNAANNYNFIRGSYVGANLTTNLTNLVKGYVGAPRLFEVGTNVGIGWIHGFTPNVSDANNNHLGVKTGLDFNFNLGASKASVIQVKPAVLWNLSEPGNTDGVLAFNQKGAQLQLAVGYVYKFKTSNGTHNFKTYDVGAMYAEIDNLKAELAKKPKVVTNTEIKEVTKIVPTNKNTYVFFAFDSDELDERAIAELDKIGQNGVYTIEGFASNEGTAEYNLALSQRRADKVKEYLENRGCRIESAIGKGVQFGLSTARLVIVTIK